MYSKFISTLDMTEMWIAIIFLMKLTFKLYMLKVFFFFFKLLILLLIFFDIKLNR